MLSTLQLYVQICKTINLLRSGELIQIKSTMNVELLQVSLRLEPRGEVTGKLVVLDVAVLSKELAKY
jgi:hypothetical protein